MAGAHDPWLVTLAIAVCAVASLAAVTALARRDAAIGNRRANWLAGAGLCFGLGLWATHFIAMLAVRPPVPVGYDLIETAVSAIIAIGGGILAFAATASGRKGAWAGGTLLGASIGAMHFLGMDAIRFPGTVVIDRPIAALALAARMARRLSCRTAIEAARMQQLTSATFEGIVIHRNGIILDINDALARMIGITAQQRNASGQRA